MDKNFLNKVLREKKLNISEMPENFNIENLPDDVELVLEENFPELDDSFWEEQ